jgi:uncharacterized protein (TIGR02246 family)
MRSLADTVAAEHACMRLMVGYCVYADHGQADEFAALFAEDGAWVQGSGQEIRGRDALRAYIKGRSPRVFTRHVITNMLVDIVDEDRATGVAYAVVFRDRDHAGDGPAPMCAPEAVVEYRDEFRRTAEGWKFVRRQSIAAFR